MGNNERKTYIKTPLGDDVLWLRSFVGEEALSQPFLFEVEVLSKRARLDSSILLSKAVSVHLEAPKMAGKERRFHGHVTEITQRGTVGRRYRYQLKVRPWLWLLTLGTNSRIFQRKTVPEIVESVFADHGALAVSESQLRETYQPRTYCVQYQESDFNFVSRLLEEEGIYYYFSHEEEKHTLVLVDSPDVHTPSSGYATIDYAPVLVPDDVSNDRIATWSRAQEMRTGRYEARDYDFERPRVTLKTEAMGSLAQAEDTFQVFKYPGGYQQEALGHRYARLRVEEEEAWFDLVTGTGNARGLAPGRTFTLGQHPDGGENRKHLVISASYRFALDGYEANDEVKAEPFQCEFRALDGERPFRPARRTPRPVIAGLQTAKVVGPEGDEIHTDEYGRIIIKFPWDRKGKTYKDNSCWIRVAQLWAGAGFGTQHVPRIGTEVVVSFLEGDPDRPLVVGTVYNGDNAPPYHLPEKKAISGVKTDSTKDATGYNELSFDDTKDSELIHVHAQKDMTSVVEQDSSLRAGGDVEIHAGRTLELSAVDEIRLSVGSAVLSLRAGGLVSLTGTQISVMGPQVSVQGTQVLVTGVGQLTVTGGVVALTATGVGKMTNIIPV